jgi:hypothetical protein
MERRILTIGMAIVLAACAASRPDTTNRAADKSLAPTFRGPASAAPAAPPTPLPATGPLASAKALTPSLAGVAPPPGGAPPAAGFPPHIPAGTLYVCTATVAGEPHHTAIEYEPKVRELCAKHPEMGVCQYERQACRSSGGRVYDARGTEITREIEAEYDRKVMRTRFRAG